MSWFVAALWAVLTGVAAGINPDWQSVVTRQYTGKEQAKPKPDKDAAAGCGSPGTAPGEKDPQVRVDVPTREGEFASGVPFAGGPKIPRSEQPGEDSGRRKRRTKPAPTAAEQVCARCKAAIEHELQEPVDVADLARTQEAETDEAAAHDPPLKDAEQPAVSDEHPEPSDERNASVSEEPPRPRGPIGERVTLRLGTRGALTRLVEQATTKQATGG